MSLKHIQLVAVALALAAASTAYAQTTGRIDGTVQGADGEPLPGVTLTIDSDSLQGERLQVTGVDGRFRFLALVPGEYRLRANLDGFSPLEQTGLAVQLDRTVSLQLTMSPGFGEEVTVSGAAPIVDTSSTTSGANFGEELFEELPVTRTFQGLAFAAPGVVDGGAGTNPSIGGASAAENRYLVDGLDTTDSSFGTIGSEVPFEFIKEVEVKTGGYEAEYGGALGGVLNVITKSGGNSLQGDVFGYWSDDSLQSEEPPTATVGQDLGFTEYDFGVGVGGKLIQDRLWYFLAVNPSFKDTEYTTASELLNTESEDQTFFAGKLTWQASPSHQFVASVFGDTFQRENDLGRASYGRVGNDDEVDTTNLGLTYNGSLTSSLFAEVSAGRYDQTVADVPLRSAGGFYEVRGTRWLDPIETNLGCGGLDGFREEFAVFLTNPGCLGGSFHQEEGDNQRDELRASLTWFGGTGALDHEIKMGGIVRDVQYRDLAHYPGAAAGPLADANGDVFAPDGVAGQRWQLFNSIVRLFVYDQDSTGNTDEQAVFVQDRVRFGDHLSVNLGLRADAFHSTGDATATDSSRQLEFDFSDMVAPRFGVTWDVLRNGRSKLYGHYGRFFESVPLDINARAFGNEQFFLYDFFYPQDGSLPTIGSPGDWFRTISFGNDTGVGMVEPMYTQEILGGFEYEVMPNVALGIRYVDRSIENVIEDISVDGGSTYFVTNPGGCFTSNPVGGGPVFDDHGDPIDEICFPRATREYEAIELTLNKRFADNWQLYASYVNSENVGNYGGLFRQETGQLDPNITSVFDLASLLDNAFGPLPNDREHQFKVYGSYLWPFKLVTGFYGQFLSGPPLSQLGAHENYGRRERFVTPRGSFGNGPDIWNVDLHLEYPIQFAGGQELKLIADIFNVSDQQEATTVDQEWNFSSADDPDTAINELTCGGPDAPAECVDANRNFGQPTTYQSPRTVRLGVKLSF